MQMHKIDCCGQMSHEVSECLAAVLGNVGGECECAHTNTHMHPAFSTPPLFPQRESDTICMNRLCIERL